MTRRIQMRPALSLDGSRTRRGPHPTMNRRSSRWRSPSRPPTGRIPRPFALGIDLGATKVASGLVGSGGAVLHHSGRFLHANDGPAGVVETVLESVRATLDGIGHPPDAVGIAVAAQVDPDTGTVVHAPNLGWRNVALGARLAEELGHPVTVVNDARAATLAEWRFGTGIGTRDLFCLLLGTGVGGSAVVGGHLLEGDRHALGEVGHLTVVSGGRRCHCPNRGCLEAYVGGWAIAARAQEAVRAHPRAGAELLRRGGSLLKVSASTVFEACRAGDPLSTRIVRETVRVLEDGAVSIANAFNPEVLAVGGGLVAGWPSLVGSVRSAVRARCQPPAARARVVPARFKEHGPLVGAAEFARERARPDHRR